MKSDQCAGRLARATAEVRADLRALLAKCSAALDNGAEPWGVIRYVREVAGRDADLLTAALRARAGRHDSQRVPPWPGAGPGAGKLNPEARP